MRRALILLSLLFADSAFALECKAPAQLKQAEATDRTLLSWCEVNGVKNGVFEQFSVEGGLQVRAQYSEGKLEGPFTRYWPNGSPAVAGEFKNDKMSGEWTRFVEDGKVRDVVTWKEDKPVIKEPEAKPFRTSDTWRWRAGLAMYEDNVGDHRKFGPGLGLDLHLFEWGRWLRVELQTRIGPEYDQENQKGTYSGILSLALEPLAGFLDPVALTAAVGPRFIGTGKSKGSITIGLRYHWNEKPKGFSVYGVYAEIAGDFDDNNDNSNNNNNNMGPPSGNNPNNDKHSGTIAQLGVIFSF